MCGNLNCITIQCICIYVTVSGNGETSINYIVMQNGYTNELFGQTIINAI